jgi:hypothetical protein
MNLTTTVTEGVALLGSFQIPNNYLRLSASTFIVIVLVAFVVRFVRYRQSFKVFVCLSFQLTILRTTVQTPNFRLHPLSQSAI